jgi:hypothetical protein
MPDRYQRHICYLTDGIVTVRVADPGTGAFSIPGSWIRIRDSGWKKYQSLYLGSGRNIPDPIFENLVSVF